MTNEQLPEVELYSIGPNEADHAAPLLTAEAVEAIKSGEAFGMALVEEGEVRAAACARLLPENEEVLELISLSVAPAFRRRARTCGHCPQRARRSARRGCAFPMRIRRY